jgi:branched-chain amino acid transport system permease protein
VAAFAQHVVAGLAAGAVYGLLGVALLLVRRATGVFNVAQAELATLSAYVCLTLTDHGWAFWPAFGATLVFSLVLGAALHVALVRPVQSAGTATVVVLTAGLLLAVNGFDSWVWGGGRRRLPGPFSTARVHVGGAAFSKRELGVILVALATAGILRALLRRTRLGLGLRAAALDPLEARFAGISTAAMNATAWGLATTVGAVAGMLAATTFGLEPNMLRTALLYGFAAALLGGLAGGLALGVGLELLAVYVHSGAELRPLAALAVVLALVIARRA